VCSTSFVMNDLSNQIMTPAITIILEIPTAQLDAYWDYVNITVLSIK